MHTYTAGGSLNEEGAELKIAKQQACGLVGRRGHLNTRQQLELECELQGQLAQGWQW